MPFVLVFLEKSPHAVAPALILILANALYSVSTMGEGISSFSWLKDLNPLVAVHVQAFLVLNNPLSGLKCGQR